jgi:hypothetical protein
MTTLIKNCQCITTKPFIQHPPWHTPKLLDGFNCKPKCEHNRRKNWGTFLSSHTSRVEGRVGASGWGLRRMIIKSIIPTNLDKPTSLLVHNWSTFGAQTNHDHTRIHHSLDLGEVTTFPFIIFFVISHRGYIQMSFCPGTPKLGVPKFSKLKLPQLWRAITSCENVWLKWSLKQSCSPYQELSKDMWHHMHATNSRWFLTFSGQESNWHFDSQPFFWP